MIALGRQWGLPPTRREATMLDWEYADRARRRRGRRETLHEEAERLAVPALDWLNLVVTGFFAPRPGPAHRYLGAGRDPAAENGRPSTT
jgi:hypothetical protein